MAIFKPFKSYLPKADYVEQIAAVPYDVLNTEEARELVKDNSLSFLHIDKAEIDLPTNISPYDDLVYETAKNNLNRLINEGYYSKDNVNCFYIYSLTMFNRTQTGIVGTASIDDYLNNVIKKHELTRDDKLVDRIKHVDICNAQTGPIFLTYKSNNDLNLIIKQYSSNNQSLYSYVAEDGIKHEIWRISDSEIVANISNLFKNISSLYIADGHHRTASAVKVGLKRRSQAKATNLDASYNYFLSVVFPHDELLIMDYNRLVSNIDIKDISQFLNNISNSFEIEKVESNFKPERKGEIGMYHDKSWYKLIVKESCITNNNVLDLDVSILQRLVLEPQFGIIDPKTDKRLDFVGGIRGIEELVNKVDCGLADLAFALYPTSIEEVMAISDEEKQMPPKSTWFEPKLRSGIFINALDE
ncbi:MAG: hypothetical protein K0S34_266 [Bacillales bacterium]|jgi:uncharacterized protein (DUF1015 family)|nr:hypothetical protein [Bacillales bacterium]